MKSSVFSVSSSQVGNKVGSTIKIGPEESMQDFEMEIQKMLDLASTYFCIKSEFLPKNYISFYGPETEGVDSMFKEEMDEEREQFPELIQKIGEAQSEPEELQDKGRLQSYKSSASHVSSKIDHDEIIQSKTPQPSIKQSSFISVKSGKSVNSVKSAKSVKLSSQKSSGYLVNVQDPTVVSPVTKQSSSLLKKQPPSALKPPDPVEPSLSMHEQSKSSQAQPQSGDLKEESDQFQDYSESDNSVLSSVAQKLTSIKEEQSLFENSVLSRKDSLVKSVKARKVSIQKQALQDWTTIKKDGKNKSTGKQSRNHQGIKAILELERIQLSIRQLEQKFQHLMSYQLQFPNEANPRFQVGSFKKKARKLCLGQVIQISGPVRH